MIVPNFVIKRASGCHGSLLKPGAPSRKMQMQLPRAFATLSGWALLADKQPDYCQIMKCPS
ncbi:tRNA synthetase, class II [Roseibium sp. TrichSKD4]|nr:tRNA synthetase, class II [Roseibium sp. TrichSKD4]